MIAVLDAPSNLGLRPPREGHEPGVRRLARALRGHDIVGRLQAEDAGRVDPPPYVFGPDHGTGYLNGPGIADHSERLATRVGEMLDGGRFPIVLGGDCGILLGPMLALRRRGVFGLAHLDGHDDYSPRLDPAAVAGRLTAGGTALGLVTGHGPAALTDIGGLRPYVAEEHVAHIGVQREPEDFELFDLAAFEASRVRRYPIEYVREHGAGSAAEGARAHLEAVPIDGFWIHLDADILDKSVMPAVDSPNPDGLSFEELTSVLGTLATSPRALGLQIAIYDPELDPDGMAGAALTDTIVAAFS
ncbi:arginase family protein [Actinomadura darangshiensis]|uniref:Arginase family protein n=1 Tax=Actinomadura darangshiensis TaxID=705336 RepID=A0A4R5AS74_9ACTN|nr:arginase family protein [Actinomadura darangshiensis]TDD75811.1 arginase family protein [Actinomadura darangshiensis]